MRGIESRGGGDRVAGEAAGKWEVDVRADPVPPARAGTERDGEALAQPTLHSARRDGDDLGGERVVQGIAEQRAERVDETVGPLGSVDVEHRPTVYSSVHRRRSAAGWPPAPETRRTGRRRGSRHSMDHMVAPPPAPGGERQGSSRALHGRWVRPAATPAAFDALLLRAQHDIFVALVARRLDDGAIVGYANVSQIIRGPLQSAFLGFGGVVGKAGQGYMTEAIGLLLRRAFTELRLHRLEANVQPGNVASVALVPALRLRV